MTGSVIEPGVIEPPAGELPVLHLPKHDLFSVRLQRLNALSAGHALRDYLGFVAALAEAQDAALVLVRNVPLPDAQSLARCREHRLPPLGVQGWMRAAQWREVLRDITRALRSPALPGATRDAAERLLRTDDDGLERLADTLLSGDYERIDRAFAPFVAAALQVYWLHMASCLSGTDVAPPETHCLCPVCGSAPVASIVRIGAADHGLRYLSCSLCGSQWHEVRIKCVYCQSTKGISYYGIEGRSGAVKAECCDACRGYLKILYMEKDPSVDPVADDIASIDLDVLMAGQDIARSGVNFFMLGGDG
ncbi:MAG: formate dehydrogenase accessory protein FdhE [Acidiferrobacterales bacterium]